jgi:exosortase
MQIRATGPGDQEFRAPFGVQIGYPPSGTTVKRAAAAIATLGGALAWAYGPVIAQLVAQWRHDENYSHGFVVVPAALFIAWQRRESIREAPSRPAVWGAALVAISLVIYIAGRLGAELFLTRISLIGVLAGAIAFIWGRAHLRILAFPLAFLLFTVPLPSIVFNQLTLPLQLVASSAGESIIRAVGVPVLRDGNVLQLPSRTLEVVEACSGMRSIVSLLMVATLIGYFFERRSAVRVLLVLAAVPIAIVANALRVAGTGLASEWIGPAAAEGFFHTFSGAVLFAIALFALSGVQRLVGTLLVGPDTPLDTVAGR